VINGRSDVTTTVENCTFLYSPMDLPRARVLKKIITVGEGILYIVGRVTVDSGVIGCNCPCHIFLNVI